MKRNEAFDAPPARPVPGSDAVPVAALVGVIATVTVFALAQGLTYPLLTFILERQGHSASMIGASAAMTPLGLIVSSPFIPAIARRFGAARTALVCAVLAAMTLAAIGLTRNVYAWFPLRFILGAVVIQLYVLSETWMIALAPARLRGRIMGIYTSTIAIGFGGGPLVLLAVGSEGFAPFLVGVAAFALCTLCLVAVLDRLPDFERGERASVRSFLPHAQILLFSVVASGAFEQSMLSLLPVYAFAHGMNEATAAGLLTAMIVGNIALQVPLGLACERYTPRRMLLFCAAATALGCVLLPVAVETPFIWPLMVVWGAIAYGLYTVALVELGTRFSGSMLVAGNSAFAMMWGIGGLSGPPGTGLVMDWIGVQGLPLTLGLMCGALLVAAAIRAASRRRAAARAGLSRADAVNRKTPHLLVDLTLYATANGGREGAIAPGYGCACWVTRDAATGWDGWPLLGDLWMQPGESRRVGMFIPAWDLGASELGQTSVFYLREGTRVIGEATVVEKAGSDPKQ